MGKQEDEVESLDQRVMMLEHLMQESMPGPPEISILNSRVKWIDELTQGSLTNYEPLKISSKLSSLFGSISLNPFELFRDLSDYKFIDNYEDSGFALHSHYDSFYRKLHTINKIYASLIQPRLELIQKKGGIVFGDLKAVAKYGEIQEAVKEVEDLSIELLGDITAKIPEGFESIHDGYQQMFSRINIYYSYLQSEFEEEMARLQIEEGPKVKDLPFKIGPQMQTIEDNVVLTYTLWEIMGELKKMRRNGTIDHSLKQKVIEDIDTLGTKKYVAYLNDPQSHFKAMGDSLTIFYNQLDPLMTYLKAIAGSSTRLQQLVNYSSSNLHALKVPRPQPLINKLNLLNFAAIKPDKEKITPNNSNEKEYGEKYKEFLQYIWGALQDLSNIPNSKRRINFAEKVVTKASEMEKTIDEILYGPGRQKFKIKQAENEFYTVRQDRHGLIHPLRQNAPDITYDDIIGDSFLSAKNALQSMSEAAKLIGITKYIAPKAKYTSNILLIGPYGCGKTLLMKAIGADPDIVGFSVRVSDLMTAWHHHSVKNVPLMYEISHDLGLKSGKPVAIIQDEVDAFYAQGSRDSDLPQMLNELQSAQEGILEYDGVFKVDSTNKPWLIGDAMWRRYDHILVVGELEDEERIKILEDHIEGMPHESFKKDYTTRWETSLRDAPGDVMGHVARNLFRKYMIKLQDEHLEDSKKLSKEYRKLYLEEGFTKEGQLQIIEKLREFYTFSLDDITQAVNETLQDPSVRKTIDKAKFIYEHKNEFEMGIQVHPNVDSQSNFIIPQLDSSQQNKIKIYRS